MWPRLANTWPIGGPLGGRASAFEPRSAVAPRSSGPSFWRRISTSPSITSANSSCGDVRHSEVPSARIASTTNWRFLPTATFSYGLAVEATSKTFEKA